MLASPHRQLQLHAGCSGPGQTAAGSPAISSTICSRCSALPAARQARGVASWMRAQRTAASPGNAAGLKDDSSGQQPRVPVLAARRRAAHSQHSDSRSQTGSSQPAAAAPGAPSRPADDVINLQAGALEMARLLLRQQLSSAARASLLTRHQRVGDALAAPLPAAAPPAVQASTQAEAPASLRLESTTQQQQAHGQQQTPRSPDGTVRTSNGSSTSSTSTSSLSSQAEPWDTTTYRTQQSALKGLRLNSLALTSPTASPSPAQAHAAGRLRVPLGLFTHSLAQLAREANESASSSSSSSSSVTKISRLGTAARRAAYDFVHDFRDPSERVPPPPSPSPSPSPSLRSTPAPTTTPAHAPGKAPVNAAPGKTTVQPSAPASVPDAPASSGAQQQQPQQQQQLDGQRCEQEQRQKAPAGKRGPEPSAAKPPPAAAASPQRATSSQQHKQAQGASPLQQKQAQGAPPSSSQQPQQQQQQQQQRAQAAAPPSPPSPSGVYPRVVVLPSATREGSLRATELLMERLREHPLAMIEVGDTEALSAAVRAAASARVAAQREAFDIAVQAVRPSKPWAKIPKGYITKQYKALGKDKGAGGGDADGGDGIASGVEGGAGATVAGRKGQLCRLYFHRVPLQRWAATPPELQVMRRSEVGAVAQALRDGVLREGAMQLVGSGPEAVSDMVEAWMRARVMVQAARQGADLALYFTWQAVQYKDGREGRTVALWARLCGAGSLGAWLEGEDEAVLPS